MEARMVKLAREWSDTEITYRAPKLLVKEFGRKKLSRIIDYLISNVRGEIVNEEKIYGFPRITVRKSIGDIEFTEEVDFIEPYATLVYIYFKSLNDARKACIKVLKLLKPEQANIISL